MTKNKVNTRNQQGFIAIVALGIFLILGVVGIIVQATTSRTTEQVRDTLDYQDAQDLADSVGEHLQLVLEQTGSGFILEPSTEAGESGDDWDCKFGDYADGTPVNPEPNGGDNNPMSAAKDADGVCEAFGAVIDAKNDDVKISMQIKGRSEENETFSGTFDLAKCNKKKIILMNQRLKVNICCYKFIPQQLLMQLVRNIHNPGYFKLVCLLDNLNTRLTMSATSYKNDLRFHRSTLLGILISRASKLSATDMSMHEQCLYMGSLYKSLHTGLAIMPFELVFSKTASRLF